jgi:outer membrane protein insertion porin family
MRRITVAIALVLLVLVALHAQPVPDWYQGATIRDIRFTGLNIVQMQDLESTIQEFKGKPFSDTLYNALLVRIFGLDLFEDIVPEALPADAAYTSVIINFKVVERPAVLLVNLEGNKRIRSSELLDVVSIKPRSIFIESKVRIDEMALRRMYLDKGYQDVRISSTQENLTDGSIAIIFRIDEGDQYIVESIIFEGISAVSERSLKSEIPLKEKALFQTGHFTENGLDESRKAIELYYRKRGYADVRVVDIRREAKATAGGIRNLALTFVISEGRRFIFGGMSFEGNTAFSSDELAALVRQKPGSIFNYERFVQDQTRLTDLYFNNGYIFNGFDFREIRDEEGSELAFIMVIEERPQAMIEDVIIRGNIKTKDHVIRREIPFQTGDVFSKAKIMEGIRNLYNLQYFAAVAPAYEQGSKDLHVNLVVDVEEQSTADIQFGMTFTPSTEKNAFPLTGLIQWNDRNFLGNGQTFSIGANFALDSQDLTFAFKENWLLGRRWSGGIDLSFKHERLFAAQDILGPVFAYSDPARVPDPYSSMAEYLAANKSIPKEYMMEYDTWTLSIGLSTGYTFKTAFGDLGLGTGYIFGLNNKTYDSDKYRPYDQAIAANLETWLLANTLYGRAYLNALDIWYDPSEGYFISQRLSLNGFHPSEQNRYFRFDTRLEGYLTLWDIPVFESWNFKTVIGAHSGLSALLPWFGEQVPIVSDTMKLRIDGTFIGRGWATPRASLAFVRGTALWENWLEIRTPIVPRVLSFDVFLDAATLAGPDGLLDLPRTISGGGHFQSNSSLLDLGFENMAFSFGLGLRFTIPQFPFRLYFARPFYHDGTQFKAVGGASEPWTFVLSISTPMN